MAQRILIADDDQVVHESLGIYLKAEGFDGPVLLESKYSLDIPKGILRMRTFWNRLEKEYAAKEVR